MEFAEYVRHFWCDIYIPLTIGRSSPCRNWQVLLSRVDYTYELYRTGKPPVV